ncbi:hypothetical protein F442_01290 [Phytophthora nicotianae P10297]|uniref:Uncharacterized protein n=5 Tax=Phytophthora nicotianae TaxID=4792 RepID=V9FX46_PHYNI|nr:hypothetical protein F443_01349 [Phytophthora nicotianae P1569]ETM55514.1 hypothetical protein L914_01270 [Phytophthora nicotianae]ETO84782.1 hypothetical protein F444_01351 [Phytophthora nicotianae P1976]ETP53855.1 hypothetical protein F442_01290 [Phytophthora nicotianae P10297]
MKNVTILEQTYATEELNVCAGPLGSPQQFACLIRGNGMWTNPME